MKKTILLSIIVLAVSLLLSFSYQRNSASAYTDIYTQRITELKKEQQQLEVYIRQVSSLSPTEIMRVKEKINTVRLSFKKADFWLRYLEPIAHKKINGPLPVEWETEVFEKFEAPYKREGAGLTLAANYLEEENINKDSLANLIRLSIAATDIFLHDSITSQVKSHHHFFLTNRLFLLNLAAIYTTGYECPDTSRIVPELLNMLQETKELYKAYNESFTNYPIHSSYLDAFDQTIAFVKSQPANYLLFDHFHFIQRYINPLYKLNHDMLLTYKVRSTSFIDYSLNKNAASIFDKSLFRGQNYKGLFIGITDSSELNELKQIGKLLFHDPILSGNNKRSCASCHKPNQFFTDTTVATHLSFDQQGLLSRNTPSLLNTIHNHLLMADGKHYTLEAQAKGVMTNAAEMGSQEEDVLKKVMSCKDYKVAFKKYLKKTPSYSGVTLEHISSAIMLYYGDLGLYTADFDKAMNGQTAIDNNVKTGFNIFMGKAQCGTCHFVPQFNGVKPPYTGSEFEVLGVPADKKFLQLSPDHGRHNINPAKEMASAFRTTTVRNTFYTKPYMHNGVFTTLEEVIDFYDAGGGAGKGLKISNQTLSSDSLRLTKKEKADLIAFIQSLNEDIPTQRVPSSLPVSSNKQLNNRKIGGEY
jgi:cytochrome c peroxidase